MKKLSVEQKVKAYDEALERAKGVIEQNPLMEYLKKGIEYIFPELKESEDERIKKGLLYVIEHHPTLPTEEAEEYIAWLEKQGTPAKLSEEEQNRFSKGVLKSCALSFIDYLDAHKYEGKMCVSNGECEDIENAFHNAMWDRLHRYYCKYIEKQGEQPADKVEPIIVRDFNSAFSREQVEEIDRRIEESQRMYNAKLRDAMLKVKDFPMTN